jgi:hypothetical protein
VIQIVSEFKYNIKLNVNINASIKLNLKIKLRFEKRFWTNDGLNKRGRRNFRIMEPS